MDVTLRQLRYLVAVAEEGHFGRAAERCYVSQPALSTAVRQLERSLGAQLLERTPRGVLLTTAGADALTRARAVLREVDDLVAATTATAGLLRGTVRLGVIPTVAPYQLPCLLPAVRAAFPELRLLLHEDRTGVLVDRLLDGELDVLLLALPIEAPGVEVLPLFDEPFVLAAPEGHELARPEPVHEEDLVGAAVLLLEDGHCFRDQALDVCSRAGAGVDGTIQATSMTTLVQMVANGLGATLLPASAVPVEVPPGSGVVVRPFAGEPPTRRIGLVWRCSSGRRDDVVALAELLRERAPSLVGDLVGCEGR